MTILSVTVHFVFSNTLRDEKRYETVAILFIRTRTTRWDAGSDLITVLSGFCHTLYIYIKAAALFIRSEQQI